MIPKEEIDKIIKTIQTVKEITEEGILECIKLFERRTGTKVLIVEYFPPMVGTAEDKDIELTNGQIKLTINL